MASVSQHYEHHLGAIYAWMQGGVDAGLARGRAELQAIGIEPAAGSLAVDLGAGFGTHAVPLAQLGYSVIAIDGCQALLAQLAACGAGQPIRIVETDLTRFGRHLPRPADLILCMGDTLPHLPELGAVEQLLSDVAAALAPSGRFVATFRDYCSRPLLGSARFIPVRSQADRILTCFLEYQAERVRVHDLLHRLVDGVWQLSVSSYDKLRLETQWLLAQLAKLGFDSQCEVTATGMTRVLAVRTGARSEPPTDG